jgi:hypothetical protein
MGNQDEGDFSSRLRGVARHARPCHGGKEMSFSDLRNGNKLDFWIEQNRWGLFSKPGSFSLKILSRRDL